MAQEALVLTDNMVEGAEGMLVEAREVKILALQVSGDLIMGGMEDEALRI
jgi:hypothetical protein